MLPAEILPSRPFLAASLKYKVVLLMCCCFLAAEGSTSWCCIFHCVENLVTVSGVLLAVSQNSPLDRKREVVLGPYVTLSRCVLQSHEKLSVFSKNVCSEAYWRAVTMNDLLPAYKQYCCWPWAEFPAGHVLLSAPREG